MELKNVSVKMGGKFILDKINFSFEENETIAVIGKNGAGKSTLLKLISLLIRPSSGKLILNNDIKTWKRKIGIVFPENFLYEELTVYENLMFYANLYETGHKSNIYQLLDMVGLKKFSNEKTEVLSKGMKQRLSIIRALVHDPTFLLLDEPFDGLDLESKKVIINLLMEMKSKNKGWILVSHHITDACKLSDRIIFLDKGKIAGQKQFSSEKEEQTICEIKTWLRRGYR